MSERARRRHESADPSESPWFQRNVGWIVALLGVVGVVTLAAVTAVTGPSDRAPDFTMIAYQGQEVLGSDQATLHELVDRGTPVVVNFWASSCPPCRQEMPGFQRVMDQVGDDVVLLGVDVGIFTGLGTREGARQFLTDFAIRYPAVFTPDGDLLRDYEVRSFPTTVFLDARGRIVKKHTGYLSEAQFRAELDTLIAQTR